MTGDCLEIHYFLKVGGFALDFYEVIVDEAQDRISYHLIEKSRANDLIVLVEF